MCQCLQRGCAYQRGSWARFYFVQHWHCFQGYQQGPCDSEGTLGSTHNEKWLPGRALRATDGIEHSALGRVLVSFANPAKVDAQRTKATPRAAGAAARPVAVLRCGAARL